MLVIQLTWGLFLVMMQAKYHQYTQEGLALIWKEYERDAMRTIGENVIVDTGSVGLAFVEVSLSHFGRYELKDESDRYFPEVLALMSDDEFAEAKEKIQTFLTKRFVGFTDLDTVVFRR